MVVDLAGKYRSELRFGEHPQNLLSNDKNDRVRRISGVNRLLRAAAGGRVLRVFVQTKERMRPRRWRIRSVRIFRNRKETSIESYGQLAAFSPRANARVLAIKPSVVSTCANR